METIIAKEHAENVCSFAFKQAGKVGWKQDFLLMSDIHWDSRKCDRDLLKKHLAEAQSKGALIFIFGDLFDIMQGRKDRRSSKHDLDIEILKEMQETGMSYYDVATAQAIEFFMPYKENMAFISYGNHETAINTHNEFDVIKKFAKALDMITGGYEGYIKLIAHFSESVERSVLSKLLKYHHGYGGAKRSKGMLDSQLFAYVYPSADICVRGHNHYKYLDTNMAEVVTKNLNVLYRKQYYVNLGTYKKKSNSHGWEVEKGFYPTALGGWWMTLHHTNTRKPASERFKIQLIEAD